ncbi:hypothetical protein GCM10010193_09530 [Kitasatospora atroaurantiaca]|uniref:DUF1345 domain-containing protein n=1 Tax=Kitasatospora atroaurantiaca TaxID=285545 RepID=A0A561ES32_9ACTN|nr:hypothetical protein [Kitasatospora atroaurantiaca]TWE18404.1 hypothetical protein FB465_3477 [Kitasatospora atroaurantiaca]
MSENKPPGSADQHELVEQLHRRLDRIESLLQPEPAPEAPAWREPTEGEERWAVTLAILLAVALQLFLPARLTISPHWLLPALELALLVALAIAHPHRHLDRSSPLLRSLSLSLVAAISLANAWSAVNLVRELLRGAGATSAVALLATGGAVWATNVIAFALWYWEWDRGGPAARALGTKAYPDFLFPQMQQEGIASPAWRPYFLDYFYVAFTNATAFSPTDTMPLSAWAKLLMITQSVVSLLTVLLVVARAVGILQ